MRCISVIIFGKYSVSAGIKHKAIRQENQTVHKDGTYRAMIGSEIKVCEGDKSISQSSEANKFKLT